MIRIKNLEEFISLSSLISHSNQGGEALNASEFAAFMKNNNMTIDLNLACGNGGGAFKNLYLEKPRDSVK